VDYYGGLADLRAGLIRVLHSLSFVDDPTRILRAVRFERRLGFTIEPRTMQLIETALPMLRRITGERIRNELALLLAESDAASGFPLLQARGILEAIHPSFVVPETLGERFGRVQVPPPWGMPTPDLSDLRWCLMLASLPPDAATALAERLHFSKGLSEALVAVARIVQEPPPAHATPSQVVAHLDGTSDLALYAAWLVLEDPVARHQIWQYAQTWRFVKAQTDGHTLQERGLKP
jgi:tRNA nucleotidyltransferase (CCA-adding enzyme)